MVSHTISERIPESELCLETVLSGQFSQIGFWIREGEPDERRALNCMSKMGVRNLSMRRWKSLSQGEKQKVAISRSLMLKPKLLILDEPCAGLDPAARASFLNSMDRLVYKRNGPQLALVTHHIEEITPSISHVIVLKNGRVVTQGRKEDVLNSEVLSEAYGTKLRVLSDSKRCKWTLGV
jgi:iron complex transport system ATP-binding protein